MFYLFIANAILTIFHLGFFGVPGPGVGRGGGGFKSHPLHKSKCIDAMVMKLGGKLEHYYLNNFNKLHAIITQCT